MQQATATNDELLPRKRRRPAKFHDFEANFNLSESSELDDESEQEGAARARKRQKKNQKSEADKKAAKKARMKKWRDKIPDKQGLAIPLLCIYCAKTPVRMSEWQACCAACFA